MRQTATVKGLRIAYDDAGTGELAVALIHGWGFGDPSHLAPQFEHLASQRRTLKLDLPGHGQSDRPPAGFGFKDCAATIVATLDAAGIDRAVVCGHSFGGRLAVEVAAAYPSRIAGIALLDPVILFPEPVRTQSLATLAPALESERWLDALEAYFGRLLSPYDPPALRSQVIADLSQVSPEFAVQIFREGMATDGSEALARVRCPVLLVAAGGPVQVDRLLAAQPETLVGKVIGSGHWLTITVPDQVNAMLDRFLQIVESRAGAGAGATQRGVPDM